MAAKKKCVSKATGKKVDCKRQRAGRKAARVRWGKAAPAKRGSKRKVVSKRKVGGLCRSKRTGLFQACRKGLNGQSRVRR